MDVGAWSLNGEQLGDLGYLGGYEWWELPEYEENVTCRLFSGFQADVNCVQLV